MIATVYSQTGLDVILIIPVLSKHLYKKTAKNFSHSK